MRPARRAFTLLEAVVALALLSAVAVASLSLRGSSVAASVRIERRLDAAQAADATLRLALAGALFEPASPRAGGATDEERDAAVFARWEGRTMELPCECVREAVRLPAPRAAADVPPRDLRSQERADELRAIRFVARCDGEEATIVLPAP